MQTLVQDIRYALRQLRKAPGFAITSVLTLALGLGATTAMLAVVESVLVRPLDFKDATQLMIVGVSDSANPGQELSWPNYLSLKHDLPAFSDLVAYTELPTAASTPDGNDVVLDVETTSNLFDVLGVKPALGRTFIAADENNNAAVLSYEFWRKNMHAERSVIGHSVKIQDHLYTVVGVMPASFQFPIGVGGQAVSSQAVWTTIALSANAKTSRGFSFIQVLGRLKPGVTQASATAQGESLVRRSHDLNADNASTHFWLFPYLNTVVGEQRPALLAMLAGCFILLFIACVNIANLQIARATSRDGEISLRSALGASRARILQQILVESVMLSLLGVGLGLGLAAVILRFIRRTYSGYPRFDEIALDLPTFTVCFAIAILCGVAAGLAPAIRLMKTAPSASLQQSGAGSYSVTRRNKLTSVLVAGEVALTFVLLVAGGLFFRTLRSLEHVPLGFDSHNVSTFLLWPQSGNAPVGSLEDTYDQLIQRLQHTPGIQSAGLVTSLPISNFTMHVGGSFKMVGRPENKQDRIEFGAVSPDYLKTMSIPITRGRGLTREDTLAAAPVIVVNETFANRYFPGKNPIGQQFLADPEPGLPAFTIVGVVGDTVESQVSNPAGPFGFISYRQLPLSSPMSHFMIGIAGQFAVRSSLPQASLESTIREAVKQEAPTYAIDHLVQYEQSVNDSLKTRKLSLSLAMSFGMLALVLAAVGVQGVLAYVVSQRVREIGIRIALGATRQQVLQRFLRQGLIMTLYGLAAGWVASLIAARWLKSFLYGVPAHDFTTFAVVGIIILTVALVATLLPARRAASIDPMQALRSE
jgi:putative ABC transport system permease protein